MDRMWPLALLCLLRIAPLSAVNTLDPRTLEAYDCDDPRDLQDVVNARRENCHHLANVERQENATLQLLQNAHTIRTTGHLCSVVLTRTPHYCGVYDHQTMYSRYKLTEVHRSVTPDVCRRMIRERKFTTNIGEEVDVRENEVTVYFYEHPGRTYVSSGEVKCIGAKWTIGGEDLYDMVVSYEIKITLQQETFITKEGQLRATTSGVNLPCQGHEGACQTPRATYVWAIPDSKCPMAYIRTSTGIVAHDNEDREVFMSTDGSLIRLVLGATVSSCGDIIRKTNYDHIYIYAGRSAKFTQHQVDPADVDVVTYVNNRDDYLYNHLLNQVEQEMNEVLKYSCRQRAAIYRPAIQISRSEVATYSLGNGTFATQAGETLWTYQCKPVTVTAREVPQCYLQLPIYYGQADPKLHEQRTDFFLEPFSRRITTDSVQVPCNDKLHSKYSTRSGNWIMATPKILDAKPPEPTVHKGTRTQFSRDSDWSQGGVYTTEELKAMKNYMEYSRYKDILSYQLARQYQGSFHGTDVSSSQLFPNDPGLQILTRGLFYYVADFVYSFGHWSSIFLGTYVIFNFFSRLLQSMYRVLVLKDSHGFSAQMLLCLCPDFMMMRKYREDYLRSHEIRQAYQSGKAAETPMTSQPTKVTAPPYDFQINHGGTIGSVPKIYPQTSVLPPVSN